MIKPTESVTAPLQPSSTNLYRHQLGEITDEMLSQEGLGKLRDAAIKLHALFSDITGMDGKSENPADVEDRQLAYGKAISPRDAARCVLDFARTAQFLKGINAALLEAQTRFTTKPVEVLYAGCGPFATLVTPLTTRFSPEQVQFTLLDVHARSLEVARQIFDTFGIGNYVREYVQADATTYVPHAPFQVIIAETMHRAVTKEPQVALTANLAQHLSPGGIFIPEQITVDAYLYDPGKEFLMLPAGADSYLENVESQRVRINLGTIIDVTAQNSFAWIGRKEAPSVELGIPGSVQSNLKLMLATKVKVFGPFMLDDYDSGITYPLLLPDAVFRASGTHLEFTYCLGPEPGFKYHWTDKGKLINVKRCE